MTRDDSLSSVLRDFARTMLTDYDDQQVLDVLVQRIVRVLPVTGAGVTLIASDRAPRCIAASDRTALRFEQLQSSLGQGPCLAAYDTGEPVSLADLARADGYPDFAPAAVAAGLAAVFTFPLHHGEQCLGALDLYRDTPGALDPWAWDSVQVLADVASAYVLSAAARHEAQRIADGELVLLCEDVAAPDDAEHVARRTTEEFATRFDLLGARVPVMAGTGVAYAGPGHVISPALVADADSAIYHAKGLGGTRHHLSDVAATSSSGAGPSLEQELRTAAARGELQLAYQPIVRTATGDVVGVEALLRWMHPALGAIPATAAVALAEGTGHIGELGAWVLERSCRARSGWLADHPGQPLDLAVNVSPNQVLDAGYASSVARILDSTGMDPSALTLEVTEGIFLSDGDLVRRVFDEVRALGVRLALDDFGTGSSSNYLRRFPVDVIKIDQSFVIDLGRDAAAETVVTATIALAHGLGMTVIAEGVQTEAQRDILAGLGCALAQGHLYAEPMTDAQLRATLVGAVGP